MEKVNVIVKIASLKEAYKDKWGEDIPFDLSDQDWCKNYLAEENKKRTIADNAVMRKRNKYRFYNNSLWSGDPVKFTFADWDVYKQPNVDLAKNTGNKAYILAAEIAKKPINVLMLGNPGTGKTSLAVAMMHRLQEQFDKTAMLVSTDSMSRMFSHMYDSPDAARTKYQMKLLVKAMIEVDVLVLDDFGTEGGMRGAIREVRKDMQERLYDVADARFGKKSTIVTSNNTTAELAQMYNAKLLSRLITRNDDHKITFDGMEDVRASMI